MFNRRKCGGLQPSYRTLLHDNIWTAGVRIPRGPRLRSIGSFNPFERAILLTGVQFPIDNHGCFSIPETRLP